MALITEKLIFIHVPRTGGHAIREALKKVKSIESNHFHERFCDLPKETVEGKKSIGIIREPIEWMKSMYRYVKDTKGHYDSEHAKTFDMYVNHYLEKMKTEPFNKGTDHYCTQSEYLRGVDKIIPYGTKEIIINDLHIDISKSIENKSKYKIKEDDIMSVQTEMAFLIAFSEDSSSFISLLLNME